VEATHTIERVKDGEANEVWAILKLKNSAAGVPASIVIEGAVKCIICDGWSERLVCPDCVKSVQLVRAAGNIQILESLIEFASRPGMLAIFGMLTDDVVADLMMKRIEDARSRD